MKQKVNGNHISSFSLPIVFVVEMNARHTHTYILSRYTRVKVSVCVCRLSHILQHQIIFDLLGAQHTLHFQEITNIEELWNPKRSSSSGSSTHPIYTSIHCCHSSQGLCSVFMPHTDNSNNNNEQALIIIWREKKERKKICNNM